jgi:chitodextrinase
MLWVNESQGNRIEAYTAANITATVDASFSVNEEFNNEQYVFVSDTSDVDGTTVTEYKYEWGDGSSPTTNGIGSAGHQYNDGTYTVTLTVSTEAGVSDTATQTVDIPTDTYEPPPEQPGPPELPDREETIK